MRYLLERQQSRQRGQGAPAGQADPATLEELRKELRPHAERQVRATLILEKISENEKVEVAEAELQKRVDAVARAAGDRAADVKQYYARPDARENLRSQMVMDRTIDLMLERAQTKEVEPAVDAGEKNS